MLKKLNAVASAVLALTVTATLTATAAAAPPHAAGACTDYSVQADDWLSKLSEKFLGDVLAYPVIVDATTAAAQSDASYAAITNPDVIEIGWKLCIPADGAMMAGEMMDDKMDGNKMADGAMMDDNKMSDGEMADGETMDGEKMMDDGMMMKDATTFNVTIENIGDAMQSGDLPATPFAPGVWAVHTAADPLFTAGQTDRGLGLEALAEDGNPAPLAEALAVQAGIAGSGVFNTPTGSDGPGPLLPGGVYQFSVDAAPGDYLSLALMFVQSNDLFVSPDGAGIALFGNDGAPLNGDVTGQLGLWDAGTEVNQAPGIGADQAPRQAGPNTGAAEGGVVQPVSDSFSYPATADIIRVTITPQQ